MCGYKMEFSSRALRDGFCKSMLSDLSAEFVASLSTSMSHKCRGVSLINAHLTYIRTFMNVKRGGLGLCNNESLPITIIQVRKYHDYHNRAIYL